MNITVSQTSRAYDDGLDCYNFNKYMLNLLAVPITAVADSGFPKGRGKKLKKEPDATKDALFFSFFNKYGL